MIKRIFFSATLFLLIAAGVGMCMIQRSCRPTRFRPVDVQATPLSLATGACSPDTSGYFHVGDCLGFALHFSNEYVAEAAVEPGILGIADSLTGLSVFFSDSSGVRRDVTSDFFYGLPDGCGEIGDSGTFGHPRGRFSCDWVSALPGNAAKQFEISDFMRFFNRIGTGENAGGGFPETGLQVEHADFTFWSKQAFAKNRPYVAYNIVIKTASGKRWEKTLRFKPASSRPQNH